MKKSLLFLGLMLCVASITNAQVSFFVQAPSANEGGYEISVADAASADWGVPDMNDPANVVVGTMCIAEDSLACEALTNGADLTGKIAVVYRGACQFGTKAINAQNEGAIAVIIINHSPGTIPMGGGDEGAGVTIPVIMISNSDGAILHDEIASCNSTAIIGNLNGYFENNLRLVQGGVIRAKRVGNVAALAQNEGEFGVQTGAWIYNFGQVDETAGELNVSIDMGGSSVYDETTSAISIPVGDSIFVMMPDFAQSTYDTGEYDMNYNVSGTGDDQFSADNTMPAKFEFGDVFSYARLNMDNQASPTNYTSPAETVGEQNHCILFEDENASRIVVEGMTFSGTHFTETITDMDITLTAYEWSDTDEGLATAFDAIDEIDSQGYTFEAEEDDAIIYLAFDDPIELEDETRYLFCIVHQNEGLQLGYDNKTDYTENANLYARPIFPFWDDTESFPIVFGPDLTPAISLKTSIADGIEEISNDVDTKPYPNPANEIVNIPFANNMRGAATINIFNLNGQLISSQKVNVNTNRLSVDVSSISNGNYVFNVVFANEKQSTFNVIVNR